MGNAPCKDCTFRHLGCHSSCAKYLEWKQILAVEKQHQIDLERREYQPKRRRPFQ